jgi:hypothetical protein
MALEPWFKIVNPRKEVREGRSFDPSEFAIALEQVVDGTAPPDYKDPEKFLARTSFTKALREYAGLVLRRLSGQSTASAPVLTLITQFGGGKTHTLTLLYHLINSGAKLADHPDVAALLRSADVKDVPKAKAAVFVGGAWDPQEGRETPWIDIARQLAGDAGVALLGRNAKTTPPGTDAIRKIIAAAGGSALFLFDEVLNCLNRHRSLAEPFYAFIQNLTVATTGSERSAAVISLPRSQVEMTDWDQEWQEKITRVVRRVAKDLIANDESEISEVIRKRLFDDLGKESVRKAAARTFADWCFDRRSQLPPEWTAVDTSTTEAGAREFLRSRFETCYPFHPSTLTVFQRKWASLPQFQQTRGTLAMLAQWVSLGYREGYQKARREPLITIGSAPLDDRSFRSAVLGQLGESRLVGAIEADIGGTNSHATALDADATGPLRDIHRRVGITVLFESSGGQGDKVAHLPDLRFALGEPEIDTTSIDNAIGALARKGYYIRKVGTDGYRFGINPTLNKVVNDRRASLDGDEIRKACESLVRKEFDRGAQLPVALFPPDGGDVADTSRLTIVVLGPEHVWDAGGEVRAKLAAWTKARGTSPRLYPGALLWAVRKPGRDLRDKVENWLAWRRVEKELHDGTLPHDLDRSERTEVAGHVRDAEESAQDEVWASYRYIVLADREQPDGVDVIDLGAGHASESQSLTSRIVTALKMESRLNDSVGAGYLERKWPPALLEGGAWPLAGLRKAFLDGSLGRLLDVEGVLKTKIPEFVARGEFGVGSGGRPDGGYARTWFEEPVDRDEIVFDPDVFLLRKERARCLRTAPATPAKPQPEKGVPPRDVGPDQQPIPPSGPEPEAVWTIRLEGDVPPDVWNRIGTRLIPKLRAGDSLSLGLNVRVTVGGRQAETLVAEIRQALADLQLTGQLRISFERGTR